jgi:uncharacterized protein with beta-barrel porin domain
VNANGGRIDGAIANNGVGAFEIRGSVSSNNIFTNSSGATLAILGGGNYSLYQVISSGEIEVDGGGTLRLAPVSPPIINNAGGQIDVGGGGTVVAEGLINNGGTVNNGGTFNTKVDTNTGTITNNGAWNGILNSNSGTVTNNNTWNGAIGNAGTFLNHGAVSGLLTNIGTTTNSGTLNGGASVLGGTLTTTGTINGGVSNAATVNANGGAVNGAVANNTGATFNVGGTVTGDNSFANSSGATLAVLASGNYTVNGPLTNSGAIAVAGTGVLTATAGGITNTVGGTITVAAGGTISDDLSNAGTVGNDGIANANVAANTGTITNNGAWNGDVGSNAGTLTNNGAWTGAISNAGAFANSGTVSGVLINTAGNTTNAGTLGGGALVAGGTLTTTGTVNGGLTSAATVNANGGAVNGLIVNNAGGAFNVGGTVTSDGNFANWSGATLAVLAGGNYTIGGLLANNGTVVVDNAGTLTLGSGGGGTAGTITVRTGGVLTGTGNVIAGGVTVTNGGTLAPGTAGAPATSMHVIGTLTFAAGSSYQVTVNPTAVNHTVVTGAANLTGGTVTATYLAGTYLSNRYTILTSAGLGGTTFAGLTNSNLPAGVTANLTYDATNAYLNLVAPLGRGGGVGGGGNQHGVANAINSYFNSGGPLPPGFVALFGLSGSALTTALSQLTGEASTAARSGASGLMNGFLGLMVDPYSAGAANGSLGGTARAFAPEEHAGFPPEAALAYASAMRGSAAPGDFYRRWSVWGTAFGGYNKISGESAGTGSADASARAYGTAAGIDYRVSRDLTLGVALGGTGTNWGLAQGLGGGSSDAFQAGVYGVWRSGGAYLAGSAAFAWHWMSTDRVAFANDRLTATFDAESYGGRIESGYRFVTPIGGVAPYGALQAQRFHTPGYAETDVSGGGFGLSYASRSPTDTRSELGARFDRTTPLPGGMDLTLRTRLAWAHDWADDPTLAARFQALPGASFTVDGATAPKDSMLATAAAEMQLTKALSVALKLDGEYASRSQTYAGTGTLQYQW